MLLVLRMQWQYLLFYLWCLSIENGALLGGLDSIYGNVDMVSRIIDHLSGHKGVRQSTLVPI